MGQNTTQNQTKYVPKIITAPAKRRQTIKQQLSSVPVRIRHKHLVQIAEQVVVSTSPQPVSHQESKQPEAVTSAIAAISSPPPPPSPSQAVLSSKVSSDDSVICLGTTSRRPNLPSYTSVIFPGLTYEDKVKLALTEHVPEAKPLQPGRYQVGCEPTMDFHSSELERLRRTSTFACANWLSGDLINCTLHLCEERNRLTAHTGVPGCKAIHSLMMNSLVQNNKYPRRTSQLGKLADNFSSDRVLVPCNPGGQHWVMLVVDHQNQTISSVDSLKPESVRSEAEQLQQWLVGLFNRDGRMKMAEQVKSYSCTACPVPSQHGGNDCGVAIIWAADRLSRGEHNLMSQPSVGNSGYKSYRRTIRNTLSHCSHLKQLDV